MRFLALLVLVGCGVRGDIGVVSVSEPDKGFCPFLEPSELDLGEVELGSYGVGEVSIMAECEELLALDVTVEGDADAFEVDLPQELQPFEFLAVEVRFVPQRAGDAEARVVIDSGRNTLALTLSGTGTGANVVVEPTAVDFGFVQIGTTHGQAFAVRNDGDAELVVYGIDAQGDPWLTVDLDPVERGPLPWTLEPGEEVSPVVRLHAAEVGVVDAAVVVTSSDGLRPSLELPVTAEVEE